MPMTTPSTVRPERNLFLASVRREMLRRSTRSTRSPRRDGGLRPGDDRLALAEVAGQEFRELVVDQAERHRHGPQPLPVLHPDEAALAVARLLGLLAGGALDAVRRPE